MRGCPVAPGLFASARAGRFWIDGHLEFSGLSSPPTSEECLASNRLVMMLKLLCRRNMLNDYQINDLWQRMLAAETRALYFADLSNRYTNRKQIITGVSFFLSSGAAATIIAKYPDYLPITMSIVVALMTAYSFATNLDRRIGTAVKLHSQWSRISDEYGNLWNHTYTDDAGEEFEGISARERELSEMATTEMPSPDWNRLEKWQQNVLRLHHLAN